ncbi:radical SAM family heme chaperone HemW [Variovorax sp. MHTC-1]|uniref:radical SAM family heme chaperone HemW n=1 Tax=Variovorax sp. MHTC-1 TaxID=2495593 RepID=UPI000F88FF59|nr:radical SAM family heme chaperone HemW [Variovorax sp. MHTC-1]RST52655.1 radical SAM family heme chaperone HemW [Variovorax sp. MHTC-1]
MNSFEVKDNEFVAYYPVNLEERAPGSCLYEVEEAAFYVHIPFCDAICDYCGFPVARKKGGSVDRYLEALLLEISTYGKSDSARAKKFICGHFGGGTPSILEADQLRRVLGVLRHSLTMAVAELTLEANPLSLTEDKAHSYREAGVNRLSLGIQSFSDETLKTIGRPHRRKDVDAALKFMPKIGFDSFSIDLIYGVPGQTTEGLKNEFRHAIESGATHISAFRLEVIPFTRLALRRGAGLLPPALSDRTLDEMDDVCSTMLGAAGYTQYGAFSFARTGFESLHNAIAFCAPQRQYVGFGNGAYSFADGYTYCNEAQVDAYIERVSVYSRGTRYASKLSVREQMERYWILGIKMRSVPRAPFIAQFGLEPEKVFSSQLGMLCDEGYMSLDIHADVYIVNAKGLSRINNMCKLFYGERSQGHRQVRQFEPTIDVRDVMYFVKRSGEHV